MTLVLTEAAANEIKQIFQSQDIEEGTFLRIGVSGGGCAGLQYSLGFDTEFEPTVDASYDQHGVKLVTKKNFALHLDGTTIDFKDGPMGRGFAIDNPNYQSGCPGCGGH